MPSREEVFEKPCYSGVNSIAILEESAVTLERKVRMTRFAAQPGSLPANRGSISGSM